MRSEFADKFNHDEDAAEYDEDVLNEADPIRAGYDVLLDWVAAKANAKSGGVFLDLGAGTANLSVRLKNYAKLYCVDISTEMRALGEAKLAERENIEWAQADLLEFFDKNTQQFDAIVSTYAIHHLTESEKALFLEKVASVLTPGGIFAFGDLMFETSATRNEILANYRQTGRAELAEDIEDEFFWDIQHAQNILQTLGVTAEIKRVSELSWGISGRC